jgi:hypothetical protein
MSDLGCRCGYEFPYVTVQVATLGTPSDSVHLGLQCPRCLRWYGHTLALKGRVDADSPDSPHRGRITKGGNA